MRVQLLWHMHQPYYGVHGEPELRLPWVRLHAVKSYLDMAVVHREFEVHSTINLSASLLEQLVEYQSGKRDTWYRIAAIPADSLEPEHQRFLLHNFFSAHWGNAIHPFPGYDRLLRKRERGDAFSVADFRDLQVWHNLAWLGFTARRRPLVRALFEQGQGFDESQKQELLDLHIELIGDVLDAYRDLQISDHVELSTTPMYHPILPLVIDSDCARQAMPDVQLPAQYRATASADRHVEWANDMFSDTLGSEPVGMWPAEGSISNAAAQLMGQHGVNWIASDEYVLGNSLRSAYSDECLGQPWRVPDGPTMFFRDHVLSDQIGFVYSSMAADDAVSDFMARCHSAAGSEPIVSVILDGENPWEHYPGDGEPFLMTLFGQLEDHETTTPSMALAETSPGEISLCSGSWINGDFGIWIGHPEDNQAWQTLVEARRVMGDAPEAARHLMVAEGSDWFWWYGDQFSNHSVDVFDQLFRDNVKAAYQAAGLTPPTVLDVPIKHELNETGHGAMSPADLA